MEARKILNTYLRRLTNLSSSNRSLLLLRLSGEQLLDLHKLSFLSGKNSFSIIQSLIAGKATTVCDAVDARMQSNNEVSYKLKRMARIDELIYEERGSRDLHIGWPLLRGKFNDDTLIRCPLLFFPIKLSIEKNKWVISLRKDAGISFNKSFLLAYAFYNQTELDEELLERGFEDFDTDTDVFRSSLYEVLKSSKVEIDFNAENFRDELSSFEEFTKESFESITHTGRIKLFPEAVIGIFPQAGSQLVPDYNALINESSFQDLEEFFLTRTHVPENNEESFSQLKFSFAQNDVREEKICNAFELDAHQELALKYIKLGHSVVIQGPPGTGKSQLICNLMSDAIANGKRVLVVSQKRAALDVVFARMQQKELSDFIGLLHDHRDDRKALYKKIETQINRLDEYRQKNNSIDAIKLERDFTQSSRRIDQICDELEEFKQALYDESACGISPKELYLSSDLRNPQINLKQGYMFFDLKKIHLFLQKLKSYHSYARHFQRDDYILKERKSFAGLSISDLQAMTKTLQDLALFHEQTSKAIKQKFGVEINLEEAEAILRKRDSAVEMLGALRIDVIYDYFQHMYDEDDDETSLLWLNNIERILLDCFNGEGPESTLPANQLGKFQEALQRSMASRRSLIKLIRWELFSDDKYLIKRVLVGNKLKQTKHGFNNLVTKIDNRLNLEHNITKLKSKKWLSDFPESLEKTSWEQWFQKQKMAVKAKLINSFFKANHIEVNPVHINYQEYKNRFESLFEMLGNIPERKIHWQVYLSNNQINQLIRQPAQIEKAIQQLKQDFDALCEFDKIKSSFSDYEASAIEKLYDQAGIEVNFESLKNLFNNSCKLAWIEHLESKYPVLRSVSSLRLAQLEEELQMLVHDKQEKSKEIVLLKARERVNEDVEFNRLRNRITYRDLHHQVSKKKRIWPIRKLIQEFEEEVFKLVPCWMASPETVSAIFPMRQIFDIVIFDEASQCFAERGIPSMYRGRQIVIAGDDKQLKPFELYQLRWEEENEQEPELEVDSLLELVSKYLMQIQLKGHYRSRSPELINFSNQYFYNGHLNLVPDRNIVNAKTPAIKFEKTEGIWENNTNVIEAERVINIVADLQKSMPEKSIGIVSFNAPQQMLLIDLLENYFAENRKSWPDGLIVKNIENVQGDEKDIIIFSIAYAPNKKGKLSMQFGSLNIEGGENRLNVAITRAKEKVIIVSSILPQQMQIDEIKNEGPKLLKAYLEYAFNVSSGTYKPVQKLHKGFSSDWYLKTGIMPELSEKFKQTTFSLSQLPQTDIEVSQNEKSIGVLLSDDENYYQAISAKEIHAYLPTILQQRNWPFHRLYSREWWLDKEKVIHQTGGFLSNHAEA